jgi:hypothetical protein
MKSNMGYLKSMKLILEFLENIRWKDKSKNCEKKYDLQFNFITNAGKSVAQTAHTDYRDTDGLNDCKNALPYTIFLGFRANSKLIVWNGETYETIEYGIGDVVFLAGDVIHAGPTYAGAHSRMQVYADTDVRHNNGNPNEWLNWPFNKQPLAYELDQGVYDLTNFESDICKSSFETTYKVKKKVILDQLKWNESNPTKKKIFFNL